MADPEEPPKRRQRRPPPKKPNGDDGDNGEHDGNGEREPHKEEPEAVQIHEAYLEHRRRGGEEPSPEGRLRAIEAFERLPGAVRTTPPAATEKPADDEEEGPER
jgi:hypothetical protein